MLSITYDLSALTAALARLPAALDARHGPMHAAMDSAMMQLMRFEERHFVQASGGGGPWPDITLATKAARLRRQLGKGKRASSGKSAASIASSVHLPILDETGSLRAGLFDRGANGHFQAFTATTTAEGAAGGSHPRFAGGIGRLAEIHQYGLGRVPARPVYVAPDGQAVSFVAAELGKGFALAIQSSISPAQYGGTG